MTPREAMQVVVLGANGTGKTTYLTQLANAALERGERVLVVTTHLEEWTALPDLSTRHEIRTFTGGARMLYTAHATLELAAAFRGGMLVLDDCRAYLLPNTDIALTRLMISRRQQMVDVFAVGHGFTTVPPAFFTYTSHIALFRTADNIASRRHVLSRYDDMRQAQERVNAKAIKQPHYHEIIRQ
jgi:ABC-type Mn2+/Zn2+ transport system ATPase subunit